MPQISKTTLVIRNGAELGIVADVVPISEQRQNQVRLLAQRPSTESVTIMTCRQDDDVQPGDYLFFKASLWGEAYSTQGFKVLDVFPIPSGEQAIEPYTVALTLEKESSVTWQR